MSTGAAGSISGPKRSKDFIREKLAGLQHLFVFLSHPDKDHINWLPDVITEELSITVFMSGDWLGKSNEKGNALSEDVAEILEFVSRRDSQNTNFFLPYYWDYASDKEGYHNYDELKQTIIRLASDHVSDQIDNFVLTLQQWYEKNPNDIGLTSLLQALGVNNVEDFTAIKESEKTGKVVHALEKNEGTAAPRKTVKKETRVDALRIEDLIKKHYKKQDGTSGFNPLTFYKLQKFSKLFNEFRLKFGYHRHVPKEMFQGNLKELINSSHLNSNISDYSRYNNIEVVLENIFIWALNQDADDPNDQSAIVSCTVPDINMSFVFTGDARDFVFRKAQTQFISSFCSGADKKFNGGAIRAGFKKDPNHLVWLSLPHHGSEENISPYAYELFKPNGFLLSVGSTSSFGHPSYSLIRDIRQFYKESPEGNNLTNSFYEKFRSWPAKLCDFVAITRAAVCLPDGKSKTSYQAHQVKMFGTQNHSVPILCPNIRGHISIVQTGGENYIKAHGFNPIIDVTSDNEETKTFVIDYECRFNEFVWDAKLGQIKSIKGQWKYENLSENIYVCNETSCEESMKYIWVVCTKPEKRVKGKLNEEADFGVYRALLLEPQ